MALYHAGYHIALGSSTAAWVKYSTTNFTGLTFLTGCF